MEGVDLDAGGGVAGGQQATVRARAQTRLHPDSLGVESNLGGCVDTGCVDIDIERSHLIHNHPPPALGVAQSDWLHVLHLNIRTL